MAAPTKTVPHPGRALAALVALIVIMLLGTLGGELSSPGHWHKDFKVGLGLDLSSGTQVTMEATLPTGGIPSTAEMNEAISIILARVNATGRLRCRRSGVLLRHRASGMRMPPAAWKLLSSGYLRRIAARVVVEPRSIWEQSAPVPLQGGVYCA